jgi:membrane dipeptidase
MNKTFFFLFIFCFVYICLTFPASAQVPHLERTDPAAFDPFVADTHNDTMMLVIDEETWLPAINIGEETPFQLDLPKAEDGGLNAAFFAAYTSGFYDNNPRSISRIFALLNALYWTEEKNPERLQIISDAEEILEVALAGKLAAVPAIEGAYSLEEHNASGLLQQYHDLGVQIIGFNWNYSNSLGEGADRVYGDPAKTPSEGGLTELGEEVVKEMNRLGMVIDVSHMARETFADVIEVTEAPIIASHSGVFSLKEHQRNLTDEEMLALRDNGGVLSIVFYPAFLTEGTEGYLTDIADHVDYAVDLMGIDHVGLGSDFDGAPMPEDLQTARDLPKLAEELFGRGYSIEELEKLLGGNILRVLEEAQNLADTPSKTGPVIEPEWDMGEAVSTPAPIFTAKINTEPGELKRLRVIVDGITYDPVYDEDAGIISLELEEPLQEKFHAVTFQAATLDGGMTSETRIFYIEGE